MVAERWPDEDADARVLEQCAQALDRLHERIAHRFGRVEVRARVRRYIAGLLERVDARMAGSWPKPSGRRGRRVSSGCSQRLCGMPRLCATTCAGMWSSIWATEPAAS